MAAVETSPDFSDGCMIALYPPAQLATTLTIPDGLPAAEMHVTVAYIGDAADIDAEALMVAAKTVADRAPIDASISGHARFTGGDSDVIVALIDSADLETLRCDLVDALTAQGIDIPRDHGYTPHLTITYLGQDDPSPVDRQTAIPVTFGALAVVHGKDRADLPFTGADEPAHPIEAIAREAYAHGWARSTGPMTNRVRAGCEAAVACAIESCDDPDVLEVTLQLGSLEGVWAWVYERREKLIADHLKTIRAGWKAAAAGLDVGALVLAVRRQAGMWDTGDRPQPVPLADLTAAARRWLYDVTYAEHYPAFKTAVDDALRSAAAEGRASALAVAAEQRPIERLVRVGDMWFDFDLAFDHAYSVLDAEGWPSATWIDKALQGGAADAGHLLGDLIASETPYEEMVGALEDLVGGSRALGLFVDMAMSMALNQGAVDLYASEGLRSYDVLTAGDQRVCARCSQAEANNPHPVTEPSPVSLHPSCRCTVAATEPLNPASYQLYLPEGDAE